MKVWSKNNLKGDPIIWGIAILLSFISILIVYSASSSLAYRQMKSNTEYYLLKQSFLIATSLFVMWIAHQIDYRYYTGIAKATLWIAVPVLFFTWKYGVRLNEASRWLIIPGINKTFQPADFTKIALIIKISTMLAKKQQRIDSFWFGCFHMFIWSTFVSGLIALTNLSEAVLLFSICMMLMYVGGVPTKHLCILILVGISVGTIAFFIGQRGSTALHRVIHFVEGVPSFQGEQSYIAIATGGIYGKGPGKSSQRNFLPHPYSDFIYAILIEEYGFIGGMVILFLYLTLLSRGVRAFATNKSFLGGMLSLGLGFLIVIQALVHMGVAVGLVPITGIPLPFVSMGGTSLLCTGVALGIMLSVSRGPIDKKIDLIKYQNTKGMQNTYKT